MIKSGIFFSLIMLLAGASCGQRKNSENTTVMNNQEIEKGMALATFGNGCFWCTEAIFQQLKGVTKVVSGYAGGKVKNPSYKEVCSGLTGHAEVIQITYEHCNHVR